MKQILLLLIAVIFFVCSCNEYDEIEERHLYKVHYVFPHGSNIVYANNKSVDNLTCEGTLDTVLCVLKSKHVQYIPYMEGTHKCENPDCIVTAFVTICQDDTLNVKYKDSTILKQGEYYKFDFGKNIKYLK